MKLPRRLRSPFHDPRPAVALLLLGLTSLPASAGPTFCNNPPLPRFAPNQNADYPNGADVLTCAQNGKTEVWTITDPYVSQEVVTYPSIPLYPGDVVEVKADGCVQTGGTGATWKRYVVPLDGDGKPQDLYYARVAITSLTGKKLVAGPNRNPVEVEDLTSLFHWVDDRRVVTKEGILTLGYRDDHHEDNGYARHDNGTKDQCLNSFGVTVTVTIERNGFPDYNRCEAAGLPPGPVFPGVPEFTRAATLLAQNEFRLGLPATPDTPAVGLLHFQAFQEGTTDGTATLPTNPRNSAELQDDGCLYLAATPASSPTWYAIDLAFDHEPERQREARPWDLSTGGEPLLLTYATLQDRNRSPISGWRPTTLPGQCGGAGTAWRTSPPRWIKLCPTEADLQAWEPGNLTGFPAVATARLLESGKRCGWSILGQPDIQNPNSCMFWGHPEWAHLTDQVRTTTSGVVTNSYLSGLDFGLSHNASPGDWRHLGERRELDLHNAGVHSCAVQKADGGELCADWELNLLLDPDARNLLAADEGANRGTGGGIDEDCLRLDNWRQGNSVADLKGALGIEAEQWYLPFGYRPEPGDRAAVEGFWIVDCGHANFQTEIHPPQIVVSSYLQTAPYQPVLGSTWNRPKVAEKYETETKGLVPATITKVILTPVWDGPVAEYDVWPPARPDAGARLHWTGGPDKNVGVNLVSVEELPVNNPNHLHVTVRRLQPYTPTKGISGSINNPDPTFLFLASYMLWWKEN